MTTGRFAPSPSGSLHVGNLRTALIAWCLARQVGGRFLVRMEDLTTGAEPVAEAEQLSDLAALGLDHDGPVIRQSDRTRDHDAAIAALTAAGSTYPCFCTRREIREAAEAPHGPPPDGTYPGTCRDLTAGQLGERRDAGRPEATRLRAEGAVVGFEDRRLGTVERVVDDFVLRRADGVAAYNLAVVVDDADQRVDQVVRGDDLVDTTPRQVLLQRLLDLPTPEYVHVPLVLGGDGERLSKRHGAVTLTDLRTAGWSSDDLLGMLSRSIGVDGPAVAPTAQDIADRFDLARLPTEPWTFRPSRPVRE